MRRLKGIDKGEMSAYTLIMNAAVRDPEVKATAEPCYCMQARRASRALTELYERELAPFELTLPQFSLLRSCQRLGPIGISDFATRLKLDRTTLGRNLKLLEKAGLVALDENSEDQRERLVSLTREGARRVEQAVGAWSAAQEKVKHGLGKPSLAALNLLVKEIESLAA
jgi:DNA-binding MarR family transcriptional regulator